MFSKKRVIFPHWGGEVGAREREIHKSTINVEPRFTTRNHGLRLIKSQLFEQRFRLLLHLEEVSSIIC